MSEDLVMGGLSLATNTLGQLFQERSAQYAKEIRVVRDFKPGFVQRAKASVQVSWRDLYRSSCQQAQALRSSGVGLGDHVVLLIADGLDFITAYFALQLLGAVAVPLVPPWSMSRLESQVRRIRAVCEVCRPRCSILDDDTYTALSALHSKEMKSGAFGKLIPLKSLKGKAFLSINAPNIASESPAMIQFTSGSTGEPKGVTLSHRALLENSYAIGKTLAFHEPGQVGCSWLPLFHDMGLIGHVIAPLLWRIPFILLPPQSFALRPISWLEAMSGFGATISTAPSFAFQILGQRLHDTEMRGLNLAQWRVAMCGGEPISAKALEKFAKNLAPFGFQKSALCPVYGLAEFSLAATLNARDTGLRRELIDPQALGEQGKAVHAEDEHLALSVVNCGSIIAKHEIRIVDSAGETMADGFEGEVEVRGPSLMSGYLNNQEATDAVLHDGWLRTGDRGYLRDRNLFMTGRSKEVIIKGGRNYYPQDIEAAAGEVPGIRGGRVVAIGVAENEDFPESIVVLCETKLSDEKEKLRLEAKVIGKVSQQIGLRPDKVVILEPGSLSKTSSGKLQRLLAKERYLRGQLTPSQLGLSKRSRLWLARSKQYLRRAGLG